MKVYQTGITRREGALLSTRQYVYQLGLCASYDVLQSDDEPADFRAGTERWTQILEDTIRLCPVQWSWIYLRRRASPGNPRLYCAMESRFERDGAHRDTAEHLSDQPAETADKV